MEIKETVFVYKLTAGEKLNWHGRYHSHGEGEYELHFFTEGEGAFLSNETAHKITGGRLFLVLPHEFHSILPKAVKKPLTYYAVLFSVGEGESLWHFLSPTLTNKSLLVSSSDSSSLKFILEDMMKLSKSPSPDLKRASELLLESCIWRWFGEGTEAPHEERISQAAKTHVRRSLKFMESHVAQNCSVEQIALSCGLSEEHFIRIFKAQMKTTPHRYFMRLKVQQAALALINSSDPVTKIASDFSFETQSHFSRTFKKCTGLSPSVYRAAFLT